MTEVTGTNRRTFLRRAAGGAGAVWVSSLQDFSVAQALGETLGAIPYGLPSEDRRHDGPEAASAAGWIWILVDSWTGDVMSDGVKCPALHDGMAVVDEWHGGDDDDLHRKHDPDRHGCRHGGDDDDDDRQWDDDRWNRSGKLVLVRNHEPAQGAPYLANRPDITFAADGAGGTTNLIFDARQGKWLRAWSTLAGTIRNCAGGVTPWGTWITNEETTIVGHGGTSKSVR